MPQPRIPQPDQVQRQVLERYTDAFLMAVCAVPDPHLAGRTLMRLILNHQRHLAALSGTDYPVDQFALREDELDALTGLLNCVEHLAEVESHEEQLRMAATERGLRILRGMGNHAAASPPAKA